MSSKSELIKKREALRSKICKKKQDVEELNKQIQELEKKVQELEIKLAS